LDSEEKRKQEVSAYRNIFALGFVSFFTDVSSEMVFSLLPTFIIGLPGSNEAILGLIEGSAESLSYGLRAFSGFFSDKFRKRKIIVLIGYAFSNIVKPFFYLAQTAAQVLIIRIADRVGKAVRTAPRDALISESVSEKHRGAAFGLHRTLDQTGAIIGPIIASVSMLMLGLSERDIFLISFVPGLVAIIILLLVVQEKVGKSTGKIRLLDGVGTVLKGDFRLLLIVVAIFSLGSFNYSFLLIHAEESGISPSFIPLVYATINIAHTLVAIPSGLLSDKIGKEKALLLGYGAFFVTDILLFISPKTQLYSLFMAVIFGAYMGIIETVQRAMVPKYAESAFRGTAYGFYYLVAGFAFFGANTVVGALWHNFGSSIAALYSLTSTSMAIIGMLLFLLKRRKTALPNETH